MPRERFALGIGAPCSNDLPRHIRASLRLVQKSDIGKLNQHSGATIDESFRPKELVPHLSEPTQRPFGNDDGIWEDLIVSILAVNQYSLEKTYAVVPLLRSARVVDPANLTNWELEEVK